MLTRGGGRAGDTERVIPAPRYLFELPAAAAGSPTITDWITAIATGVTALVAGVALVFAWLQVREARRARNQAGAAELERAQPHVVMWMEPSSASQVLFDIVIRNFGPTEARNITLTLDPWPKRAMRRGDSDDVTLPDLIPVLAPGQEFRVLWDNGRDRKQSQLPSRHEGTVSYQGLNEVKRHSAAVLDWSVFMSRRWVEVHAVHDVAKALMEIKDEVKRWSEGGSGGLRVTARDGDVKDVRAEAEYEEHLRRSREFAQQLQPDEQRADGDEQDGAAE